MAKNGKTTFLRLARKSHIFTWPGILFLVLSIQIFGGLKSRWILQNGDAAGYVDILSPDAGVSTFRFAYGFSTTRLFELIRLGTEKVSEVGFLDPYQYVPFYQAHPYLIGFIIRFMRIKVLPIEFLPLAALSMSYAIGLVALVCFARKNKINTYLSLILISIILTSPIFIFSLIGQPYIDRLSFGPFIIIFLKLIEPRNLARKEWIQVLCLILICILLSERSSLMVGVLVITLTLLTKRRAEPISGFGKLAFSLALLGIGWYIFWSSAISRNRDIANNSNFNMLIYNGKSFLFGNRHELAITFIFTLLPFLIAIIFRSKYFLLLPIFVAPNILVSIGGAELSGYYTHYHAMYLPIAVTVLYISVLMFFTSSKSPSKRIILTATLIFALSLNFLQYEKGNLHPVNFKIYFGQIADSLGFIPSEVKAAREAREIEFTRIFQSIDPINSGISLPEGLMPLSLSNGMTKMSYFPVGIGQSEYLIVPFTDEKFTSVEFSLYGLVPAKDRKDWSDTILGAIEKSYSKIRTYSGSYGFVGLYKKR